MKNTEYLIWGKRIIMRFTFCLRLSNLPCSFQYCILHFALIIVRLESLLFVCEWMLKGGGDYSCVWPIYTITIICSLFSGTVFITVLHWEVLTILRNRIKYSDTNLDLYILFFSVALFSKYIELPCCSVPTYRFYIYFYDSIFLTTENYWDLIHNWAA